MILERTCNHCNKQRLIEVDQDAYDRWQDGELIQKAMPSLNEDDRELLISGICGECFDRLFADDEVDEGEEEDEDENPLR